MSRTIDGVAVEQVEQRAKMPMPNPHTGAEQFTDLVHTLHMADGTTWFQCAQDGCEHVARSVQGVTVSHLRQVHGLGRKQNPNPQGRYGRAAELADTPFGDIIDAARQQLLGGDGLLDKLAQVTQERNELRGRCRSLEREITEYKRTFAKLSS